MIARPSDADTATCRGAAQYGLARRPLVSSVIAPRSYIMKVSRSIFSTSDCSQTHGHFACTLFPSARRDPLFSVLRITNTHTRQVKLPAEPEDWQKRPAYIRVNNAGVNICENRYGIDLPHPENSSKLSSEYVFRALVHKYHVLGNFSRLQYLVTKGAILRKG